MTATGPREVVVTTKTTMRAVEGPVGCGCGHLHYGRIKEATVDGDRRSLFAASPDAPYWGYCEDADCDCRALRLSGSTP